MGLITAAKLLLKGKKSMGVIKSIPPNVPKTDMQKAIRTLKVEGHKIKAKLSKIESDVFDRTQKLKKSIEKIKTPEKTKHYYKVRD